MEPSNYCVRVVKPGMVSNLALRLNPGYFITDSFALSLPMRFQFNAGKGSFSHMLIGLRGELLFTDRLKTATGFPIVVVLRRRPTDRSRPSRRPRIPSAPRRTRSRARSACTPA